jgi:hypothetical protein
LTYGAIASAVAGTSTSTPRSSKPLPIRYGRDAVLFDLIRRLTCAECSGKLDVRVHVPAAASSPVGEISLLPRRRCVSLLELTASETREGLKLEFRAKLWMCFAAPYPHGTTTSVAFWRGKTTAVLGQIRLFSGDMSPAAVSHFRGRACSVGSRRLRAVDNHTKMCR